LALAGSGLVQWKPAFFLRTHGVMIGDFGMWLGLTKALGVVGLLSGGFLASRYARDNEPRQLRTIAVVFAAYGLFSCATYAAPQYPLALSFMAMSALVGAMVTAPLMAVVQSIVPPCLRATATAALAVSAAIVGLGFGPLLIGILSDGLRPALGTGSLRYALVMVCPLFLWASWHAWRAGGTVSRDLMPTAHPGGHSVSEKLLS
jgi:MFS family permease